MCGLLIPVRFSFVCNIIFCVRIVINFKFVINVALKIYDSELHDCLANYLNFTYTYQWRWDDKPRFCCNCRLWYIHISFFSQTTNRYHPKFIITSSGRFLSVLYWTFFELRPLIKLIYGQIFSNRIDFVWYSNCDIPM